MKKIYKSAFAALLAAGIVFAPMGFSKTEAENVRTEKLDLGNYYAFWTDWEGMEDTVLAEGTTETYSFDDRRWNGLPSVCLTEGGRLLAGFLTANLTL